MLLALRLAHWFLFISNHFKPLIRPPFTANSLADRLLYRSSMSIIVNTKTWFQKKKKPFALLRNAQITYRADNNLHNIIIYVTRKSIDCDYWSYCSTVHNIYVILYVIVWFLPNNKFVFLFVVFDYA